VGRASASPSLKHILRPWTHTQIHTLISLSRYLYKFVIEFIVFVGYIASLCHGVKIDGKSGESACTRLKNVANSNFIRLAVPPSIRRQRELMVGFQFRVAMFEFRKTRSHLVTRNSKLDEKNTSTLYVFACSPPRKSIIASIM